MGWIILTVLAAILFWAGIGVWMYARHRDEALVTAGRDPSSESLMPASIPLLAAVGVVVAWVFVSFFFMVHTVGQREVAIVYNFSGTISGKKDPGVVMTAPWQHVRKENVGIQHNEFVFDQNNASVSKDQQKIFAKLAVNYQIDAENVVDLYKRVGPSWKSIIIEARVPQVFKEVTSTFQTPELTVSREQLRQETRDKLTKELAPYDIKVIDVFITNLGFSEQYSQAIEEKQKQVQDAQRAEAKVKQVQAEAAQRVAQAKGEAQANIERARGDATSNRLRQRSLTPRLIQWEAIQKLNPSVDIIVCPPQTVCIPNSGVIPNPGH